MLRCALFASGPDTRESMALAIEDCPELLLLKAFDHFPSEEFIVDYLRAHAPQILFFDIGRGREPLLAVASAIQALGNIHIVGVDRNVDPEALLELMQAGVREFLRFPFERPQLLAAIERITRALAATPGATESSHLLYSFLPAKPGVGCSMTAIHTAIELAARPQAKVLFCDLDLNCGASRFLLKLGNPYGLRDVAAKANELDEGLWSELISRYEELDLLPTGLPEVLPVIEPARLRAVLEFARKKYRLILADHSGMLEAHSVDVLRQSRRILLVVEPDLAAVHMAREKLRFLESEELADRVALVINRWRKDAVLTIADLESVLGVAAEATLADAPEQIYKSVLRGGALDPTSTYAREIGGLATWMASEESGRPAAAIKRKIEFFTIMPSRYSLTRG